MKPMTITTFLINTDDSTNISGVGTFFCVVDLNNTSFNIHGYLLHNRFNCFIRRAADFLSLELKLRDSTATIEDLIDLINARIEQPDELIKMENLALSNGLKITYDVRKTPPIQLLKYCAEECQFVPIAGLYTLNQVQGHIELQQKRAALRSASIG